jgi:hypothetical protein
MFNKAKFAAAYMLFFILLPLTYIQASDLSPASDLHSPMLFSDSSERLWEDSPVASPNCSDSPLASSKVIDPLEACTTIEYIEVPGKPLHHACVFAHNLNFKAGEAPAAVGILSSRDRGSLYICKAALIGTLKEARSSNLTMKGVDTMKGADSNPFFVHRRSIIYGPDVVTDFELKVDDPTELFKVTYSLAFPQGPDMQCEQIIVMPHADRYIIDLAHDSETYKQPGVELLRIKNHAQELSRLMSEQLMPTCTIPLLIVDLKKMAEIVAVEKSLYSRHA